MTEQNKNNKCRCYINAKYYAKVASSGQRTMKGYIPCPIHEKDNEIQQEEK